MIELSKIVQNSNEAKNISESNTNRIIANAFFLKVMQINFFFLNRYMLCAIKKQNFVVLH